MGTFTNSGGTFATDSALGTIGWTSGSNAQTSDNAYATSVLLLGQISIYLKVTNFQFFIPLDATITGITVSIERSTSVLNATHDNSVKLVKADVVSGDEKASVALWPTSDATATYGSSTDMWGLTLTPADINNTTFGVVLSAIADITGTAQIDYISITIAYTGSNKYGNRRRSVKAGNMSISEGAS